MMSTKELSKLEKDIRKKKVRFESLPEEVKKQYISFKTARTFTSKDVMALARKVNAGKSLNESDYPEDVLEAVARTATAIKVMEPLMGPDGNGKLAEGNAKFISERLRLGYIGMEIKTNCGKFLQLERGKPYGTCVAVKSGNDVSIGYSFINERDEKYATPIVGLFIAYQRALEGAANKKHGFEYPIHLANGELRQMDSNTFAQLTHFEKRAKAYFHPDVYSFTRGQDGKKVVYDNYDEIHARQLAILGPKKMEKNAAGRKSKKTPAKAKKATK